MYTCNCPVLEWLREPYLRVTRAEEAVMVALLAFDVHCNVYRSSLTLSFSFSLTSSRSHQLAVCNLHCELTRIAHSITSTASISSSASISGTSNASGTTSIHTLIV